MNKAIKITLIDLNINSLISYTYCIHQFLGDPFMTTSSTQGFAPLILKVLDNHFYNLSKDSNASAPRSLTWLREWTNDSKIQTLFSKLSNAFPHSTFSKGVDKVTLSCSESAQRLPLTALNDNRLQNCQLEVLNAKGEVVSHSVRSLVESSVSNDQTVQQKGFLRLLNLITLGDSSSETADKFYHNDEAIEKTKNALTFNGLSKQSTGEFSASFKATITSRLNAIWQLVMPGKEAAPQGVGDLKTLTTECTLVKDAQPNTLDCLHTLKKVDDNWWPSWMSLDFFSSVDSQGATAAENEATSVKVLYDAKNTLTISGPNLDAMEELHSKLKEQGASVSSLSTSSSEVAFTVNNQSYWEAFKAKVTSFGSFNQANSLSYLLIPAGIGLAAAGAYYAKSNYEDSKKSTLRKSVGMITGIGTAALGLYTASMPLGIFS